MIILPQETIVRPGRYRHGISDDTYTVFATGYLADPSAEARGSRERIVYHSRLSGFVFFMRPEIFAAMVGPRIGDSISIDWERTLRGRDLEQGIYQDAKTLHACRVLGIASDLEAVHPAEATCVVYESLHDGNVYLLPLAAFEKTVSVGGYKGPRFIFLRRH